MVVVAYERWSLTRGFKYIDLTWNLLVFWKTGPLREAVTTRGSTLGNVPSALMRTGFQNSLFYIYVGATLSTLWDTPLP